MVPTSTVDDRMLEWLKSAKAEEVVGKSSRLQGLLNLEFGSSGTLKPADVAWVLDKLSTSASAGLPLIRILRMLSQMRKGDAVGKRCGELADEVSSGESLADAMEQHRDEWGMQTIAMIRAGESSGKLPEQLARAARSVESRVRLRTTIRRAMSYPTFVVVLTSLLIAGILIGVVPQFAGLYGTLGQGLPALTQVVVTMSNEAPKFLVGFIVTAVGLRLAYSRLKHHPDFAPRFDAAVFRIPVVGNLYRISIEARVAATLSGMLHSGLGILDACSHAATVANSPRYKTALEDVRSQLNAGRGFSQSMAATGVFPDMMVQLAAVGEESASLPVLMGKYAEISEADLEEATTSVISLIEPAMIVVIGAVVGFFVIALYLPILNISSALHG